MVGAGARIQAGKERREEDAKTRRKDPNAGSARRAVPGLLTRGPTAGGKYRGSVFVSW